MLIGRFKFGTGEASEDDQHKGKKDDLLAASYEYGLHGIINLRAKLKGAMSRYFRVFRGKTLINTYLKREIP